VQNDKKVQAKIRELNKEFSGGKAEWDEIAEYMSLPNLLYHKNAKSYSIDLTKGISVKLFINLRTHEIKQFPLEDFVDG
jgi:hypothetical protein